MRVDRHPPPRRRGLGKRGASTGSKAIRHQKVSIARPDLTGTAPVHRYRATRPWSVAILATVAATGVVFLTGGLSMAFSGAKLWGGASTRRVVAMAGPRIERHIAAGRLRPGGLFAAPGRAGFGAEGLDSSKPFRPIDVRPVGE